MPDSEPPLTESAGWRSGIAWLDQALDRATAGVKEAQPPLQPIPARPVDIIVPIFGAFERLETCLTSLAAHTPGDHRIWLMDDASEDRRIPELGRQWAATDMRFRYHRQAHNLGFVGNVNAALARCDRDVVLLNSDTRLTPGWLDRVVCALDGDERIGAVSPLSNNASLLSITRPDFNGDPDEMARLVAATAEAPSLPIPTGVGFCLLIRRRLIEEIGALDPAFGRGFGEEVDFCLRAQAAGWEIHACTDAYVHHEGNASFGSLDHTDWRTANERLLASRWPSYETLVRTWWRDNPLRAQAERIASRQRKRPLIIHLLHRWQTAGGTEVLTRRLIDQLSDEFDHLVILPGSGQGVWADAVPRRVAPGVELLIWNHDYLQRSWRALDQPAALSDPWLDGWLARVLAASGASLVHVHHLLGWNTLTVPLAARALGLPVLLSLHCFHYLCADYNQIGPDGLPCGRRLAVPDADCSNCLLPRLTHPRGLTPESVADYIANRRMLTRQLLTHCDQVVAPSAFLIERMARAYGPAVAAGIDKLPHTVVPAPTSQPRTPDGRLILLYFGGLKRLKGSHTLIAAAKLLPADCNVEFRLYGPDGDQRSELKSLPDNCSWLGQFEPAELPGIMAEGDLVVVPSIFEESFSLVLSEAWANGRPVLASRCGAMTERVRPDQNGWLMEPDDSQALARQLIALTLPPGRKKLQSMTKRLCREAESLSDHGSEAYRKIYHRLGNPLSGESRPTSRPATRDTRPAWQGIVLLHDRQRLDEELRLAGRFATNAARSRLAACLLPGRLPPGLAQSSRTAIPACRELEEVLDFNGPGSLALTPDPLIRLRADWLLLMEAGERPLARMLGALATSLNRVQHADIIQAEHVHQTSDGLLHGRVLKSAHWDRWLAATSAELDYGWIVNRRWLIESLKAHGPIKASELKDWLRRHASTAPPRMLSLPAMAVEDMALQATGPALACRGHAIGLGTSSGRQNELPPVVVLDCASRDHLLHSLESLAAMKSDLPVVIVRSSRKPPPGQWPTDWCWIGLDEPDPLPGKLRLILRAGLVPKDLDDIQQHIGCFDDGELAAIGFAFNTFAGGWTGAACSALAGAGRRQPHPPWPDGVRDGRPVLRLSFRLSGDISLVHARLPGRSTLEKSLLAGQPLTCAGPYRPLLASSLLAARSMDRPAPLKLDDAAQPDPVASPVLDLGSAAWVCDAVAAQKAPISGEAPQLVAVTPDAWASSQYRLRMPMAALSDQGDLEPPVIIDLSRHRLPLIADWQRLAPDVVMLHNVFQPELLRMIRKLQPRPRLVMLLDDLLTELPDYNPFRHTRLAALDRRLKDHLEASDLLVVSTEALAAALAPTPCPVRVIENAIPEQPWQSLRRHGRALPGRRLRVGWAGAQQHEGDLRLIKPLIRSTAGEVDWILFGMCPDYLRPWIAEYHAPVDFAQYPQALAGLSLDLAVAPLVDNSFNRCKSALKLLEYGSLGIPVIASDLPPYRAAPVMRVDATPECWRSALDSYLGHPERIAIDGDRLHHWVTSHHGLASRLTDWQSAIAPEPGLLDSNNRMHR